LKTAFGCCYIVFKHAVITYVLVESVCISYYVDKEGWKGGIYVLNECYAIASATKILSKKG
jgi:hypothetical protein